MGVRKGAASRHGLQLGQVASRRFFLAPEEWPAARARAAIEALQPARVVVRGGLPGAPLHFLLTAAEALELFARRRQTVARALAAAAPLPVPAFDGALDADEAPDRCVVLDDGLIVAVFDAGMDVPETQRGRSAGDLEPEAIVRLLSVEMEPRVPLRRTVSLLVHLAPPDPADPAGLPMALPPGSEVDVYVRTVAGFESVGTRDARLLVTGEEETLPVQFRLRATTLGRGRIEVLVFHDGACLGRVALTPEVTAGQRCRQPVRYEGVVLPPPGPQPDLTLIILEVGRGSHLKLLVRLQGPGAAPEIKPFGPIPVRVDPRECFNDFFHDIEDLARSAERSPQGATQKLAAKGAHLFEQLVPPDLQALLWEVRPRIRTLRIDSAEPWIPWELCRLVGREGGRAVEGGFLCEEFAMSRWLLALQPRPAPALRRIGVIAPQGSGLPAAAEERKRLLGLDGAALAVEAIEPRFLPVMERLAAGEYDGLHFAGHGAFHRPDPDRSRLLLDDDEELRPENLSGERANLGLPRPLVFLNACDAGRRAFALTGMGGWAPRFLHAGAAAFLGPVWGVGDAAAARFAEVFYRTLLAGAPIAEAVRAARLELRQDFPGNPAWLAYTVFADPLARLDGAGRQRPESTKPAQ